MEDHAVASTPQKCNAKDLDTSSLSLSPIDTHISFLSLFGKEWMNVFCIEDKVVVVVVALEEQAERNNLKNLPISHASRVPPPPHLTRPHRRPRRPSLFHLKIFVSVPRCNTSPKYMRQRTPEHV